MTAKSDARQLCAIYKESDERHFLSIGRNLNIKNELWQILARLALFLHSNKNISPVYKRTLAIDYFFDV